MDSFNFTTITNNFNLQLGMIINWTIILLQAKCRTNIYNQIVGIKPCFVLKKLVIKL